jgi:4'-phosphopantetheinyl transferase EntD
MRPVPASFPLVFIRPHAFGVLAAVRLPPDKGPVPEAAWARLTPEERALGQAEEGFRQLEFVGARLAWHAAAQTLGLDGSLLRGLERAPTPPQGVSVSLTHKRDLALALVQRAGEGRLGVDLEGDGKPHTRIASKVLRAEELARVDAAPERRQWLEVMVRFAVKEAIYKALQPRLGRYIGFSEACVQVELADLELSHEVSDFTHVDAVSHPVVTLHLKDGEPVAPLECVCQHSGGRVLAAVRSR